MYSGRPFWCTADIEERQRLITHSHALTYCTNVERFTRSQAFDQRESAAAVSFLHDLLLEAFHRSFHSLRPTLLPLLRRCHGVFLRDATLVGLPACRAALFPGRGGRHVPHGQAAAVPRGLEAAVSTGALTELSFLAGLDNEKTAEVAGGPLPEGSLLLLDMGLFSGESKHSVNPSLLWPV